MLAIAAGSILLLYAGFAIAHFFNPDSENVTRNMRLDNIAEVGLILAQVVVPILAVVFGAGLMGSEYGWNTMRPLVARSTSRSRLLSAKWVAMIVFSVVLAIASVAAAMVGATLASLVSGEGFQADAGSLVDLVSLSARYSVILIPSAALAMTLATIFRSNAVGIAVGIGISFIEPIIFLLLKQLSDVFDTIEKAGLALNQVRLAEYGVDEDRTREQVLSSTGILLIWIVVLAALSFWIFRRRDVTSG